MPGINARTFAAERKPAPADMRALAVQLMNALLVGEHLRQPHGDPKPSNLIIADHPGGGLFLQVQDWGLSLARTAHPPETLWFRAPELHAGGIPTTQSDLFTAAASLFFIATNSAPAPGSTAEEIMRDWREFDIRVLKHLRPDLDQPLCDWLGWLMQLDPVKRPPTIAQALDALLLSMQTGFIYLPQQAPTMVPGTQTAPLVSAAHPHAPRPKSTAAQAETQTSAKKSSAFRASAAVLMNAAAFGLGFYFMWPVLRTVDWREWLPSTVAVKHAPKTEAKPAVSETRATNGLRGRFVRLEIPGKVALNLAEVQVFSDGTNLALKGTATQSSTSSGGNAGLAIDGNTDGDMPKSASVMRTDGRKTNPWWELDLGREAPLHTVVIWNRTDGGFGESSKNISVKVLDEQLQLVWEKKALPKPNPSLKLVIGE